jgi:hypothetical protein
VDGILRDLQGFARRRPAAFLAAGFGLGMVVGRLVRSSDLGGSNSSDRGVQPNGDGQYVSTGMDRPSLAARPDFDPVNSPGRLSEGEGDSIEHGEILGRARRSDGVEDRFQ